MYWSAFVAITIPKSQGLSMANVCFLLLVHLSLAIRSSASHLYLRIQAEGAVFNGT